MPDFSPGQKVLCAYTFATGGPTTITGTVIGPEGDLYRVQTDLGVTILFRPEDLKPNG